MEVIKEFFSSGDFWAVVIRVLLTVALTGLLGLIGTLFGKIIAKSKNSKIYKYADTCVKAAEIKFPNEGTKMGPEKMQYVMDQMMIKFPKIRDNQYLYNIAEAAVFELNRQKQQEAAVKEFEEKYGEEPLAIQKKSNAVDSKSEDTSTNNTLEQKDIEKQKVTSTTVIISSIKNDDNIKKVEEKLTQHVQKKQQSKLQSF